MWLATTAGSSPATSAHVVAVRHPGLREHRKPEVLSHVFFLWARPPRTAVARR
jgi:hypothetical protein